MSINIKTFTSIQKSTIFGAAVLVVLFSDFAPISVQAETPGIDSDPPLRVDMQGPICGKLPMPRTVGPTGKVATHPALRENAKVVAYNTTSTFNHTERIQEFNWLSDEPASNVGSDNTQEPAQTSAPKSRKAQPNVDESSADTPTPTASDITPIAAPAKKKTTSCAISNAADQKNAVTAKSVGRIDPGKVKVAAMPHCSGVADFYADHFHGKKTASGQIHDKEKFTAAHRTLPFGTKLKVVNRNTGRSCVVTVNDRGPFTKARIIDLSLAAANELGLVTAKSRLVDCYIVEAE